MASRSDTSAASSAPGSTPAPDAPRVSPRESQRTAAGHRPAEPHPDPWRDADGQANAYGGAHRRGSPEAFAGRPRAAEPLGTGDARANVLGWGTHVATLYSAGAEFAPPGVFKAGRGRFHGAQRVTFAWGGRRMGLRVSGSSPCETGPRPNSHAREAGRQGRIPARRGVRGARREGRGARCG